MRAAVCDDFGTPLTVEDVAITAPQHGEILVEIAAVAVCHSDVAYIDGAWGGQLPSIYGHEAAGRVAAVGTGVTRAAAGDRVVVTLVRSCGVCSQCRSGLEAACTTHFRLDSATALHRPGGEPVHQGLRTGAFAERVLVHESQVAAVPEPIAAPAAALLACGVVTGFGAVTNTAQVPAGAAVVVVGAGGVGLNCIQGAAHVGAKPLIAVDLRDEKLAMAMQLGATAVVNAATSDAVKQVTELTNGGGADYVFVAVGSARAIEQSLPLVSNGGALVVVGMPPTGDLAQIDTGDLAHRGQRILGSKMGSVRLTEDIPHLTDLYLAGALKLDELVSATYSLDQINAAVDSARSGEAIRNVIVFE